MSRKDRRTAGVALVCALIAIGYLLYLIFLPFHPMSSREILRLKLKIPPSTQVVRVAEARHFSDIELGNQNQIGPEDFLKKMERGEFKVVLFPKSSSIESFRTIGFSKHVYVVEEKEWKDWFWKNFEFPKSYLCLPDVKIKKEKSQLMLVIGYERKTGFQILPLPLFFVLVFAAFLLIFVMGRDLIYPNQSS